MSPSAARVAAEFRRRTAYGSHDIVREHLVGLLGLFHALYWTHWTTHWQVQGDPFYGDHLLFERLYGGMVKEIDTLAEKMVAGHGREAVAVDSHFPVAAAWISRWLAEPDLYRRALAAELDLQTAIKQVYEDIKAAGGMTLGLDDFLMAVANDHETNVYLLQQRVGGARVLADGMQAQRIAKLDGDGKPDKSSDGHLFSNPRSHEVREFAESGAVTNDPEVARGAIKAEELADSPRLVQQQVSEAPPTVDEIRELPGGDEFGTLNRYVVDTEQPTEVPPQPKFATSIEELWRAGPR